MYKTKSILAQITYCGTHACTNIKEITIVVQTENNSIIYKRYFYLVVGPQMLPSFLVLYSNLC